MALHRNKEMDYPPDCIHYVDIFWLRTRNYLILRTTYRREEALPMADKKKRKWKRLKKNTNVAWYEKNATHEETFIFKSKRDTCETK